MRSARDTKLVTLYKRMGDHTAPECAHSCRLPRSCCSPEYCDMTIEHAKERWGVTLEHTGHARLPLMGPTGCVAEPHLRPMCTMHTCAVNSLGFKPDDQKWNVKYWELRDAIDREESRG